MARNITQSSPANGRALLEHFAAERRSLVANLFCQAVRSGRTDPASIVGYVRADANGRIARGIYYGKGDSLDKAREIIAALDAHPDEALAFAAATVEWERLAPSAKEEIKRERGEAYRADWMASQEPTSKQIAYLRRLGVLDVDLPTNRRAASEMIDSILRGDGP